MYRDLIVKKMGKSKGKYYLFFIKNISNRLLTNF